MDELSVSGVDTHVRNSAAAGACEEDDIASLQIRLGNICTMLILVNRCAVGGIAHLLQNIIYKTGTVKSGGSRTAAEIANAKLFFGFIQNLLSGNGIDCRDAIGRTASGTVGGRSLSRWTPCRDLAAPAAL